MKEIKSATDWDWYKQGLDVEAKYKHKHVGEPDRYPCKVESEWENNYNGPHQYNHTFFYKETVNCCKCGNESQEYIV